LGKNPPFVKIPDDKFAKRMTSGIAIDSKAIGMHFPAIPFVQRSSPIPWRNDSPGINLPMRTRPTSDAATKATRTRRRRAGEGALRRAQADAEHATVAAERAHARLREAIDLLPQGIVFIDADGRYILWNQQYADIYKRSADLFVPGARLQDTLRIGVERGDYPQAEGREEEWIAERLEKLRNPSGRHEQTLSDGRCVLIEERRTSDGGIIGLRVDITEMKQREASFRLLFDSNPVPMFVYALDDARIIAVNDAAIAHYGYHRDAFLGMTLGALQAGEETATLRHFAALSPDEQAGRTWKHRKADGTPIDVAVYSQFLTYEGRAAALVAAIDITERKRAETRIAHMAHHDALTALPNRVLLRLRMEDMLAARDGGRFAVLCIDLDNFKSVNDSLGHPVGDLLLVHVARRLRGELRDLDTVARLGGDEFAVLQAGAGSADAASELAERLLNVISEPYEIEGHLVAVGASIGIALATGDGADPDRLLKQADMALYRAKGDGKGAFRFFEPEMDARVQARRRLEMDLRTALHTGALQIHYQPLVDIASGRTCAFEALLRWPHRERGMIPPSDFIPVAEETGLIGAIGAFVLRQACADAMQWPGDTKVAVNLSPLQFRTGNLLQTVMDVLDDSGLAAHRLELEITETLLLERGDHVLATLHALRALGVRIAMDDFGTGYSSLSYLRSFPFDKIKIDRSFVHDLSSNTDSQAIVRAIVSLGSSLGITITAEGVENERDLEKLRAEGCTQAQGFLFSVPRPQREILQALRRPRVA
jgi:diguanylate cyclase (GGDEF)-like protein/PAS domain S-box-containing protein